MKWRASLADDLPPLPPGFRPCTGKRSPPRGEKRYHIQLRMGFADTTHSYRAADLQWFWQGHAGDVVAVMDA